MNRFFKIGAVMIRMSIPDELTPPPHFLLFETDEGDCDYEYEIRIGSAIVPPSIDATALREDFAVYSDNVYETRLLGARGREGYYGRYEEVAPDRAVITLDPAYSDLFSQDTVFSSLFALERRALAFEELVLHCAYIDYDDTAILFSAPSGVGKSTQASLWERYRGAVTKNGDRSLISINDGECIASGWPVCGSSEICSNSSHRIKAIVMLSQSPQNNVTTLEPMQAFPKIYSQITINSWNRSAAEKAITLIEKLINTVPVYHLSCNISQDAVDTLHSAIYGD